MCSNRGAGRGGDDLRARVEPARGVARLGRRPRRRGAWSRGDWSTPYFTSESQSEYVLKRGTCAKRCLRGNPCPTQTVSVQNVSCLRGNPGGFRGAGACHSWPVLPTHGTSATIKPGSNRCAGLSDKCLRPTVTRARAPRQVTVPEFRAGLTSVNLLLDEPLTHAQARHRRTRSSHRASVRPIWAVALTLADGRSSRLSSRTPVRIHQ
jgi:hypothetical protein